MTTSSPATLSIVKPPRMSLAAVRKGRMETPYRICMYGVEGVGKSSFAAAAPSPIFIGSDSGTSHLDIARMPEPSGWTDILDGVRLLQREKHDYKTVVIDPVNWCEAMLFTHLCAKNGWQTIEDPKFGKGYAAALDFWRELVVELERLWSAGMNVILLAHAKVKNFKNPEGDDFERYQLSMNESAAGLLKQWVDAVLFTKHEAFTKHDDKAKRTRGISTGARVIRTQWTAAYDAKNRYNLPEELPLSWQAFTEAARAGQARVDELRGQIESLLSELGDEAVAVKARDYVLQAKDDLAMLAAVVNAVAIKLEEKKAAEAAQKGQ